MSWVYLDDRFPEHPKVLKAGGDAAWLYVCGLAWVNRHQTLGRIPAAAVPHLSDRKKADQLARRLVDVDLWEPDGDDYLVHDYEEHNASSIERSEKARKAAQARWAGRSGHEPLAPQAHARRSARGNAQASVEQSGRTADAMPSPKPQAQPLDQVGTDAPDGEGRRGGARTPPAGPPPILTPLRRAVEAAVGSKPATETEARKWAEALRQLADAGATADEVRRRAGHWPSWNSVPLTPGGLAGQWGRLDQPAATAAPPPGKASASGTIARLRDRQRARDADPYRAPITALPAGPQ